MNQSECSKGVCEPAEYCKIQWASRNLTRIIYGAESNLGLKHINFSLPVEFEVDSDPNHFLNMEEVKKLLLFNYQGYLVNGASFSLLNFDNSRFLLQNSHSLIVIADKFGLSLAKASGLVKYANRIVSSLRSIDQNAEVGYFRGRLL